MFMRDRSWILSAYSIGAILIIAAVALFVGRPHQLEAATPTPTSTATRTGTAVPAPEAAEFTGSAWVDGKPASETIEARIGPVVCGDATPLVVGGAGASYDLKVVSESVKAGCGKPGATISFFVGGRQANETAIWDSAAGSLQRLTLIVGAPFAQFFGNVTLAQMPVQERIVPFVNNVACGYQLNPWQGSQSPYSYQVVVYSAGIQTGCGAEGAEVTFKLLDGQGNVIATAPETSIWHTWDGNSEPPRLDLTMARASIRMPPTGDGPAASRTDPALGLAMLGLVLIAIGVVSRHSKARTVLP